MPATTLSPASVAIGPQSWRNDTIQGIRQAEQLVRTVGAAKPNSGPRTCSAGAQFICRRGDRRQRVASTCQDETKDKITPLCAVRPSSALVPFFSTVSPPSLRERCVNIGTGEAVGYMRCVRSVEGLLRGQAGKVWLECRKLERDRGYLERMLRTLRKNLMVNRRSVEDRTLRPANAETGRDGADSLLDHEQRELTELKAQLEGTLRNTLTQLQALKHCSRTLLECANERSRVLDFLPRSGSHSAGSYRSPGKVPLKPSSAGPYTPECEQVMESSCAALSQSQLLRNQIRQMICESTARQNAAHQSVNEGLMRKITETVSLKQHLTVSSAATRHAINRKQRQLNSVEQSHGRALVSVCSVCVKKEDSVLPGSKQDVTRTKTSYCVKKAKMVLITVYVVLVRAQYPVEIYSPEKGWTGLWFSCTKNILRILYLRLCTLNRELPCSNRICPPWVENWLSLTRFTCD